MRDSVRFVGQDVAASLTEARLTHGRQPSRQVWLEQPQAAGTEGDAGEPLMDRLNMWIEVPPIAGGGFSSHLTYDTSFTSTRRANVDGSHTAEVALWSARPGDVLLAKTRRPKRRVAESDPHEPGDSSEEGSGNGAVLQPDTVWLCLRGASARQMIVFLRELRRMPVRMVKLQCTRTEATFLELALMTALPLKDVIESMICVSSVHLNSLAGRNRRDHLEVELTDASTWDASPIRPSELRTALARKIVTMEGSSKPRSSEQLHMANSSLNSQGAEALA